MNSDESNFGRYENSESSDNNMSIMTNSYEDSDNNYKQSNNKSKQMPIDELPWQDRVCWFDKEKAYMPLCNNAKILTNNDIYRHGTITGTALLINRTNFVVIDIDNKGSTIDERKQIFKKICEHFLPSPDSDRDKKGKLSLCDYIYAE